MTQISVELSPGCTVAVEQVREHPLYVEWAAQQRSGGVATVDSVSINPRSGKICSFHITFDDGGGWPYPFTLRTETVNILTIFSDDCGNEYLLFVGEFRPAVGAWVIANPAGGIDEGAPQDAAYEELYQELGLGRLCQEWGIEFAALPISLTLLRPRPVLVSPGSTNERTWLFRADVRLNSQQLEWVIGRLHGSRTGVVEEGEDLIVYAVPRQQLDAFVNNSETPMIDEKTLHSLSIGL